MESPTTPSEALDRAIARAVWTGGARRSKGKPGEIIAGMPAKVRALLRNLRSEDIAPGKVQDAVAWFGQEDEQLKMKRFIRNECLKFDRTVLRLRGS